MSPSPHSQNMGGGYRFNRRFTDFASTQPPTSELQNNITTAPSFSQKKKPFTPAITERLNRTGKTSPRGTAAPTVDSNRNKNSIEHKTHSSLVPV